MVRSGREGGVSLLQCVTILDRDKRRLAGDGVGVIEEEARPNFWSLAKE